MDSTFDLETKPLARALVSYAVQSIDPTTQRASAPKTHVELLETGVTRMAFDITDIALRLTGRESLTSSSTLPEEAPIIIGFSLLIMLGIVQVVGKEGIPLDANALTEELINLHLAQKIKEGGRDEAASQLILEIARTATQIPGQIVETAKGDVEDLFSTCYAVLPEYIQAGEDARKQLMPIFGTALLVLLQSQIKTDD